MINLERTAMFLAVVDTGTVTAAARQTHLSQPALTRNIQLLEAELDAQLFVRVGRELQLTAAGRAFLPRARSLLRDSQHAARHVRQAHRRGYHDLRLGCIDSVATHLLPQWATHCRHDFPELILHLRTGRSHELLQALGNEELDAVILARGEEEAPLANPQHELGPYGVRFYGRADRFPHLVEVQRMEDLRNFPVIELQSAPGQGPCVPLKNHSSVVTQHMASLKAWVMAGFGVGAVLDLTLSPEEKAQLVAAPLKREPSARLYLVEAIHHPWREPHTLEKLVLEPLRQLLSGMHP